MPTLRGRNAARCCSGRVLPGGDAAAPVRRRLFATAHHALFPGRLLLDPGMYATLGAAAFFGGTLRCTVSICVIVLEMIDAAEALPLLMLALIIAKVPPPCMHAVRVPLRCRGVSAFRGVCNPSLHRWSGSIGRLHGSKVYSKLVVFCWHQPCGGLRWKR